MKDGGGRGGTARASPVVTPRPDTRARLLEAAERLFAEHGVEGVSLREINQASGARNAVAIQYHFTDRSGLLKAILAKHATAVEAARHELLDAYEANGGDLRDLAAALVRPLAAKLADPDGGPEYLQIMADVLNRPRPATDPAALGDPTNSLYRWRVLVDPYLEPGAALLHRRFTALIYTAVELGRRARSAPHTDDRLFTSVLIDTVTGILAAPTSAETAQLAKERKRSPRRSPKPA